ncbi:hypothetical protein FC83_GL000936 [Agrilactobacillus composti DSM 18527 = JCM 14202]|uniref:Phage protein n=1 Tax=Agrilactobacillus composti DSM 18527 = JCM 14202 TaxID=1423734 RepID=X0QRA5_9LACO|nr:hypothetical protein [Agrilactobacillus composti]KRM35632.1 hypothetical protein FC83_GL000936 [Agrilactobacillus composti DSM 18527 = JCM 14202]GAF41150.1 hypothetical protein JCM14202_3075 [Agrilactobacillus composti DSM 18527 = JCM 14202]
MNNQGQQEHELGWDDTIENDGGFTLIPEGDYPFTVTSMERGRYTPGPNSKLPACNMAKLDLTVQTPAGEKAVIKHNLYLHTQTEGLLSQFFIGIGQKKKGEPLRMNWTKVAGATGIAHIIVNEYTNNQGKERTNNQVDYFVDRREINTTAPASTPAPTPAPAATQQPQQTTQPFPTQNPTQQPTGFTPGAF